MKYLFRRFAARWGIIMKIVSTERLYTENFTFANVFSMYQTWKPGSEFSMLSHERPTNAFLYFSSGDGEYLSRRDGGERLLAVKKGALVYIPKGSKYLTKFSGSCVTETILFEFSLYNREGTEFILSDKICSPFADAEFLKFDMQKLADAFRMPVLPIPLMYSIGYGIFHLVSKNTVKMGLSANRFGAIEKSIHIIETSPDDGITVSELARISNVSVGTFNRLFYEYSGMAPGAYRTSLKLERAKRLLRESFISVSEAAQTLGFDDTGYFCRWFRKNCGMTAMQYAKNHKK